MEEKEVDKVDKKRLTIPNENEKNKHLTKTETEVLRLITEEFLTSKQIILRRGKSREATYKIIRKLRKNGWLTITNQKVDKSQGTYQENEKIRLHGQEFNIRILFQDLRYQKILRNSNVFYLDSNTIKLYRNSIEVYSGQSFFGKNEQETDSKSVEYFQRLFRRLENELSVILVKNRTKNIKEVKHEYAYRDSEIYENAKQNKERIWIYAEEDGKLAFITDNSFGFNEDETVHPETAKPDRKEIDKQVNDWRLNNPPTNSELKKNIESLREETTELSKGMLDMSLNSKQMVGLLKDLQTQIVYITKTLKDAKENGKI